MNSSGDFLVIPSACRTLSPHPLSDSTAPVATMLTHQLYLMTSPLVRRLPSVLYPSEQAVDQQHGNADCDPRVGQVESGEMIPVPVEVKKVKNEPQAEAIDHVAERPPDYEAEGDNRPATLEAAHPDDEAYDHGKRHPSHPQFPPHPIPPSLP